MQEMYNPTAAHSAHENNEEYVPTTVEIKLSRGRGVDVDGKPGRFLELKGGGAEKLKEALEIVGFEDYTLFLNAETQEEVERDAQDLKSKMEDPLWQKEILEAAKKIKSLIDEIDGIRKKVSIDGIYKPVE